MLTNSLARIIIICICIFYLSLRVQGQNRAGSSSDSLEYISYQDFFEKIEKRDSVRIFYKSEWFTNKKISASFAEFKIDEALSRVKRINKLSWIILDENSYVLIPFQSATNGNYSGNPSDELEIGPGFE